MDTYSRSPIAVRRANERFHSDHGWLDSYHTFSFGQHSDPAFMGFRDLRVINDDTVAPQMGFGEHSHRDMEIISYVIAGQLEHRDSLGNGRIIQQGDFQYLSAGSGVRHSEFNPSATDPVHFLQIWITPKTRGESPRYQEKSILEDRQQNGLTLVASPTGREDSIMIRQDAELSFGHLVAGKSVTPTSPATSHWLQLIEGTLALAGEELHPGDGVAIEGPALEITAQTDADFLFFSF